MTMVFPLRGSSRPFQRWELPHLKAIASALRVSLDFDCSEHEYDVWKQFYARTLHPFVVDKLDTTYEDLRDYDGSATPTGKNDEVDKEKPKPLFPVQEPKTPFSHPLGLSAALLRYEERKNAVREMEESCGCGTSVGATSTVPFSFADYVKKFEMDNALRRHRFTAASSSAIFRDTPLEETVIAQAALLSLLSREWEQHLPLGGGAGARAVSPRDFLHCLQQVFSVKVSWAEGEQDVTVRLHPPGLFEALHSYMVALCFTWLFTDASPAELRDFENKDELREWLLAMYLTEASTRFTGSRQKILKLRRSDALMSKRRTFLFKEQRRTLQDVVDHFLYNSAFTFFAETVFPNSFYRDKKIDQAVKELRLRSFGTPQLVKKHGQKFCDKVNLFAETCRQKPHLVAAYEQMVARSEEPSYIRISTEEVATVDVLRYAIPHYRRFAAKMVAAGPEHLRKFLSYYGMSYNESSLASVTLDMTVQFGEQCEEESRPDEESSDVEESSCEEASDEESSSDEECSDEQSEEEDGSSRIHGGLDALASTGGKRLLTDGEDDERPLQGKNNRKKRRLA
ncbi:unnamed protein product [Amoebophrya sp. A120]|nr:unnamed protein product [Amoebophrya sp. A120]|eukprot:GSA120T00013058001.1